MLAASNTFCSLAFSRPAVARLKKPSPMPQSANPFQLTIFINHGINGWSEKWHLADSDFAAAKAMAQLLIEARSFLLAKYHVIEWAEVRQMEHPWAALPTIGAPIQPLAIWNVCDNDASGLLWRFDTGYGRWANHLFRGVEDAEITDNEWIRDGGIIPSGPVLRPLDPTASTREELYAYAMTFIRDHACHAKKITPPDPDPAYWELTPWKYVIYRHVSKRNVGGQYNRVSWESRDWTFAADFSPCGTAVTALRSCYEVNAQQYIDGPVRGVRYYFATAGADVIQFPTVFWGLRRVKEITPFSGPGERVGSGQWVYSLGMSWGVAPGDHVTGTPLEFLGQASIPYDGTLPTPSIFLPACDMPSPVPILVDHSDGSFLEPDATHFTLDIGPTVTGYFTHDGAGHFHLVIPYAVQGGTLAAMPALQLDRLYMTRDTLDLYVGTLTGNLKLARCCGHTDWVLPVSGGVNVGGQADHYFIPTVIYVAGGVNVGGQALAIKVAHKARGGGVGVGGQAARAVHGPIYATGGVHVGGQADVVRVAVKSLAGGVNVGGAPVLLGVYDFEHQGGAWVGGQAYREYVKAYDLTGGVNVGGQAIRSFIRRFYNSGGVAVGGRAHDVGVYVIDNAGGVWIGGQALKINELLLDYDGGVNVGGRALAIKVAVKLPSGGVHVGGQADVVVEIGCTDCVLSKCFDVPLAMTRFDSLFGWWLCLPASSGTTWIDITNTNHITWTSGTAFASTSRTGGYKQIDMDGSYSSSERLRTGTITPAILGTDWSMVCSVKFAGTPSSNWWEAALVASDHGSGAGNKWIFSYDPAVTKTVFHMNDASNGGPVLAGSTWTPTTGTWYRIGIRRSGNNFTFFKNGTTNGTDTSSWSGVFGSLPLTVGYGEGSGAILNGSIDDIQIHQRAWTDQEFADDFTDTQVGYSLPDC